MRAVWVVEYEERAGVWAVFAAHLSRYRKRDAIDVMRVKREEWPADRFRVTKYVPAPEKKRARRAKESADE